MNITTYSPALVLLFAWAVLWVLMDVRFSTLTRRQQGLLLISCLALVSFNQVLKIALGSAIYGKSIFFTMHLPTFLVFRSITKRSFIKTIFMILTALVFTAPAVFFGNLTQRMFGGSSRALLVSNLIVYALMLLLTFFIFRKGFHYLLEYGEDRLFLYFSLIPLLYYVYVFAITNLDLSALTSVNGYLVRLFPTLEVFFLYFLIPHIYKNLSEKRQIETAQAALIQKLTSAEEQISLLNDANTQTAIYQHDMRHHLLVLEGLLAGGKYQQAEEFIQTIQDDLETITLKRFCENDTVNLLCSSFSSKAKRMDIELKTEVTIPQKLPLSDTELCSLLSNGLENALHAAAALKDPSRRTVYFYCGILRNHLLIEIKNSYTGNVVMRDGLPISNQVGHGYGCHSIRTITEHHRGFCTFEPENGTFTLRVVLPIL